MNVPEHLGRTAVQQMSVKSKGRLRLAQAIEHEA